MTENEVILKCPCLASGCNDHQCRKWHHCDCPSNSSYYLTDKGYLRCDYCNKKFPLSSREWKSSSCTHEYRGSSLTRAIQCICLMERESDISRIFIKHLIRNIYEMFEDED